VVTAHRLQIQQLREQRVGLEATIEALQSDMQSVPLLEQELLFHADRADAMERTLVEMDARNLHLETFAHARVRSQNQLNAAAHMRCFLKCSHALRLSHALRTWCAVLVNWGHANREAQFVQLEYQNLLLQRGAGQQVRMSKREMGATVAWQSYRRIEAQLLERAWCAWVAVPRALETYDGVRGLAAACEGSAMPRPPSFATVGDVREAAASPRSSLPTSQPTQEASQPTSPTMLSLREQHSMAAEAALVASARRCATAPQW